MSNLDTCQFAPKRTPAVNAQFLNTTPLPPGSESALLFPHLVFDSDGDTDPDTDACGVSTKAKPPACRCACPGRRTSSPAKRQRASNTVTFDLRKEWRRDDSLGRSLRRIANTGAERVPHCIRQRDRMDWLNRGETHKMQLNFGSQRPPATAESESKVVWSSRNCTSADVPVLSKVMRLNRV